jgi:hypothetical protein
MEFFLGVWLWNTHLKSSHFSAIFHRTSWQVGKVLDLFTIIQCQFFNYKNIIKLLKCFSLKGKCFKCMWKKVKNNGKGGDLLIQ